MLLSAVDRSKPALASRNPQFITRREISGRVVEGADSNFHLVGAVCEREHGRTAQRAKVTVVGREPPASCFSGHRYFVRRPDRKKIAKRAGLFSTHEAVAKADSERLPGDLKPHLTAVTAARPLSHAHFDSGSMSLCCSDVFIKRPPTCSLHLRWGLRRRRCGRVCVRSGPARFYAVPGRTLAPR
jgi:hypothetical protein